MIDNILEISHLTTVFSDNGQPQQALKDISIKVPGRSIVGLVGQSGSGKSITAMSILRLLYNKKHTTTGTIQYRDQDLLTVSRKQLEEIRGREISMIFQNPMSSLNPVYRVGPQVEEALKQTRQFTPSQRKEKVLAMFREMGIRQPERCYHSYPHELSGGMQQRVMIAMAMITEPRLIIADEPTTALDVTVQAQILEQLRYLRDTYGTSILLITHDLGIVSHYCDYVYVMYQGQIVEQGEIPQLLEQPAHWYTRALLKARFTIPSLPFSQRRAQEAEGPQPVEQSQAQEAEDSQPVENSHSEESPGPVLEIRELYKEYSKGAAHANKNISLQVYPGETLAVVGESGSGKSTLGRQIAGLLQPTSGHIFYKGTEITALSEREKRRIRREIQIVFQDPFSLDPRMDVYHSIEEPLLVYRICPDKKKRKEMVYRMMEQTGLEKDLSTRLPAQLSGGQRQRISIARALIIKPRLIIWDEPVSALDVMIERQIIELIRRLKTEYGFTSIFITHDMAIVYHIADRVCVMKQGAIVETAEKEQLFAHPRQEYTKQLLDSIL